MEGRGGDLTPCLFFTKRPIPMDIWVRVERLGGGRRGRQLRLLTPDPFAHQAVSARGQEAIIVWLKKKKEKKRGVDRCGGRGGGGGGAMFFSAWPLVVQFTRTCLCTLNW